MEKSDTEIEAIKRIIQEEKERFLTECKPYFDKLEYWIARKSRRVLYDIITKEVIIVDSPDNEEEKYCKSMIESLKVDYELRINKIINRG